MEYGEESFDVGAEGHSNGDLMPVLCRNEWTGGVGEKIKCPAGKIGKNKNKMSWAHIKIVAKSNLGQKLIII